MEDEQRPAAGECGVNDVWSRGAFTVRVFFPTPKSKVSSRPPVGAVRSVTQPESAVESFSYRMLLVR